MIGSTRRTLATIALGAETGPQLIASKKMGTSVLTLQGTEFSQQTERVSKFIENPANTLISALWDSKQMIQLNHTTWTFYLQNNEIIGGSSFKPLNLF